MMWKKITNSNYTFWKNTLTAKTSLIYPFDSNGFDCYGIHMITDDYYDPDGYDIKGYNKEGYNRNGFHSDGQHINSKIEYLQEIINKIPGDLPNLNEINQNIEELKDKKRKIPNDPLCKKKRARINKELQILQSKKEAIEPLQEFISQYDELSKIKKKYGF